MIRQTHQSLLVVYLGALGASAVAIALPEPDSMGQRLYAAGVHFGQFVKRQCLRELVLHGERANRTGAYLLACTHISHVEPMLLSCMIPRQVFWMARKEFFNIKPLGALLKSFDSFCVNRQGVPVSAVRKSIELARLGRIVGIFPEGGCRKGKELLIRGGPMREGVASIALRAQVSIVPVVMLGTHALNEIDAWLPGLSSRTWVGFGEAIDPPPLPGRHCRRTTRRALAKRVHDEFIRTYREMLDQFNLTDRMTP